MEAVPLTELLRDASFHFHIGTHKIAPQGVLQMRQSRKSQGDCCVKLFSIF